MAPGIMSPISSTPPPISKRPTPRSRRSNTSFTPLPPLMSRENSAENISSMAPKLDLAAHLANLPQAGPSRSSRSPRSPSQLKRVPTLPGKPASMKRTVSYTPDPKDPHGGNRIATLDVSNANTDGNVRKGLKRRISTPLMRAPPAIQAEEFDVASDHVKGKGKTTESRARATSTSIVVPTTLQSDTPPIIPVPTLPTRSAVLQSYPPWKEYVTPPSPDLLETSIPSASSPGLGGVRLLTQAYHVGERLVRFVTGTSPESHVLARRDSQDSEKGLLLEEDDSAGSSSLSSSVRSSEDSARPRSLRNHWGLWASTEDQPPREGDGYFSLPPTPPNEVEESYSSSSSEFAEALRTTTNKAVSSLPTPALSSRSLSAVRDEEKDGWWKTVLLKMVGGDQGKVSEVVRDLGWTVGFLVGLFFVSLGLALWMIQSLTLTQLTHLPSSTTDLQLLSAEIRSYMADSDLGWWHVVGVLTFVGCWKHAWSVPGAVILNILVGSILEPMPALALLTVITATGSLGSYLLSRPLAPLISVLFPKPLALVRAALAPELTPSQNATPVQLASNSSEPPIASESKPVVWRRLLLMRAMGFVPWSGMNVACGVVGVDWKVFWLTTAAGSASWSYVTASVGNILSRLALPSVEDDLAPQGESLTALLRDPVLIAKLVFLTVITLIPVLLKRKSGDHSIIETPRGSLENEREGLVEMRTMTPLHAPSLARQLTLDEQITPFSPVTQSFARFAPTPQIFDLLSFGRTTIRTGSGMVISGIRGAVGSVGRLAGGAH